MNVLQKDIGKVKIKIKINVDIESVKNVAKKLEKNLKDVFNPNDISGLKINGIEVVIKDITGYSKAIEKLVAKKEQLNKFKKNDLENQVSLSKIDGAKENNVNNGNEIVEKEIDNNAQIEPKQKSLNLWDILKQKIQAIKPCIENFRASLSSLSSNKELELIKYKISEVEEKLQNAKEGKIYLSTKEIIETEAELTRINREKKEFESSGKGNAFAGILNSVKKIMPSLSSVSGVITKIKDRITQWGSGFKNGLSHVFNYLGSLISVQGILSRLGSFSNNWLSSQNSEAQQLTANIEYMKYSMGSVFAGAIQYVINLVYQLMKAMQSVVYAFSGVNIFAKDTSTSMKNTAGSAKSTSRSLAGIHNEINNVSSDTSAGAGSSSISSPDIDLSQIDNQMSPLAQKLYNFFKPLKESWDIYGPELLGQMHMTASQTGYMISSVWGSFENIITNGTIYTSLELIFSIIGNIAEKFANAWNYNGNGDAIVQSLANAFNNLLGAIDNVIKSEGFQEFLNNCSDKFRIIAEKIESIDWQPLVDALTNIGTTVGGVALDILSGFVEIFKFFVENPGIAEIILGIVIAIKAGIEVYEAFQKVHELMKYAQDKEILTIISSTAAKIAHWMIMTAMEAATIAVTAATWLFNAALTVLTSPITWVILAIGALIAIIVLCIKNWEEIKEGVINVWNTIKEKTSETIENIKSFISNGLNIIKEKWTGIFNDIKTTTSNIFNGIWGFLKGIINNILGGIEGMANGVVKGINTMINAMNKLKFNIPDWVPELGGKTFGFNIPNINMVSLPRLKTGSVLYEETAFIGGEYSGARSNPEIVSPVNLIYETQKRAIEDSNFGEAAGDMYFTVKVGDNVIGEVCLDSLRRIKRQTGKEIEVLCS